MKKLEVGKRKNNLSLVQAGEWIELSGDLIVMRDAAHKRLLSSSESSRETGIDFEGQIIFYAGPSGDFQRGEGVIGPTTSARLDSFVEPMLKLGVKGFLGKGPRGKEAVSRIKKYKASYFVTVGGAAALLSKYVKEAKIVAYQDLGPEAIYKICVVDLPVFVAIDTKGRNILNKKLKVKS